MISVYLCDDKSVWINRLSKAILDYQIKSDWEIQIEHKGTSPYALLQYLTLHMPSHGIYFLDIDFKCAMNGLHLARKIRDLDANADIIFVTAHDEMVFETFRLKLAALDYIIKDANGFTEQIHLCLSYIEKRYASAQAKTASITIHTKGSYTNILLNEIYYIETIPGSHKVRMHLASAFYDLNGSLSGLQTKLGESFVFCSKSCLINCTHIRKKNIKQKTLLLDNGESCSCSSRAWKNFAYHPSLKEF